MEHLRYETCFGLQKLLGATTLPEEGYWYIVDDPARRPFFGYHAEDKVIFADAEDGRVIWEVGDCIPCPSVLEALEMLEKKRGWEWSKLYTLWIAELKTGQYHCARTPADLIEAIVKDIQERANG